jgi:hypothetical protein
MILFSFIFSVTATIIFWLGLNIFSDVNYEATFLVSQAFLYTTLPLFPAEVLHKYKTSFFSQLPEEFRYGVYIVLITILVGMVNLYVYQDHILVSLADPLVNRMYQLLSFTFIPFAQMGGWLYQSLMVYFIAVILGTEISFKRYATFVGISYIGFLLSTLMSLVLNTMVIDFSIIEENVLLRYTVGKFGEALTLILLAFFIYYNERKFSLIKSCFIACFPTAIIILFQIVL